MEGPQRLQKLLAQAGLGSRRACELLILEGRVTVNGEVVSELGAKFHPASKIAVDGQKIQPEKFVYYLVYKPKGYVSTSNDPSGRALVLDLVPKAKERLFIVGRLDRFSEGLMLLTNDGSLTQRLLHPKYGVEKTYRVTVAGDAGQELVRKLTDGIWLAEGKVRARRAKVIDHRGNTTVLEIVLAEGKNREIRRMLARLDHKVLSLLRVAIGPLYIKGLSEG
ncbi:MAG: pseudouridine synthase, partial [Isosphaeraceae bacterium]